MHYAYRIWRRACSIWPKLEQVNFTCIQGATGFTRYEWGIRDGEPVITQILISLPTGCTKEDVRRVIAYEAAAVMRIHPSAIEATLEGGE